MSHVSALICSVHLMMVVMTYIRIRFFSSRQVKERVRILAFSHFADFISLLFFHLFYSSRLVTGFEKFDVKCKVYGEGETRKKEKGNEELLLRNNILPYTFLNYLWELRCDIETPFSWAGEVTVLMMFLLSVTCLHAFFITVCLPVCHTPFSHEMKVSQW